MGRKVNVTGWWKVYFEINLDFEGEGESECFGEDFRFEYLSEVSREHILNCIREGCTKGEIVESYEMESEEENPFKNREDERNCHCNNCEVKFMEGEITIRNGVEYCPSCGESGYIADD